MPMTEIEQLRHDIQAYRGALGYSLPGNHDGRLSNGETPRCGLCDARQMNPAIFPAAPLPASAALQDLIATMRKAAQRWDYDQHDEHDVLAWADRLEALSRADQP